MSKQYMYAMNSGDESYHDLISTEMLEDICDGSQTHLNVKRREARYKIRDHIRQIQTHRHCKIGRASCRCVSNTWHTCFEIMI